MRIRPTYIVMTLTICHLAGCKEESPDLRVKKAFEGCVKALESGDAGGVADTLAKDFQGPEGLDKAGARLYLMGLLRRERVGVTVLGSRVVVEGSRARQSIEVLLTSKGGGLLPQDASRKSYVLEWRLEGSDWRLVRVEGSV